MRLTSSKLKQLIREEINEPELEAPVPADGGPLAKSENEQEMINILQRVQPIANEARGLAAQTGLREQQMWNSIATLGEAIADVITALGRK